MHHDSVVFLRPQPRRQRQRERKCLLLKEGHRVTFVSLVKQGKFTLKAASFLLFIHHLNPLFIIKSLFQGPSQL